jgi:hypothetical protein
MRTSPGWSIAIASSTVTTAPVRCTPFGPRASIRSLIERSIELSGQNPSAQLFSIAERSEGMDCLNARPCSSSGGSKIAPTLSPSMASAP